MLWPTIATWRAPVSASICAIFAATCGAKVSMASNGGPYVQGPNYRLRPSDFPLRKLKDDTNRESSVVAEK